MMGIRTGRASVKVLSASAVLLAAGASPALASGSRAVTPAASGPGYWLYARASDNAFSAYTYDATNDRYFHVKDRSCDSEGGHGEYIEVTAYPGSQGNDNGCHTIVDKHVEHKIVGVKACTNRPWPVPDECSGFTYAHTRD